MARSLGNVIALGAAAALFVACTVEQADAPRLRSSITTGKSATLPLGDASAPTTTTTSTTSTTSAAASPSPSAALDGGGAVTPPPAIEVALADLDLVVVSNGWGPLEKNMSNGEMDPNDGKPLTLQGVVYDKGLGVHADSEVDVNLGGQYTTFLADVGVDDEVGDIGSVGFQVVVDGQTLFDSGVLTGSSDTKKVEVDVTGRMQLKLVVNNGGDDYSSDHADWAGARLRK